ncbi:hypothetical protein A2U01_0045915, partial [Trifolium medium]|nr:hypothetical protein [Trifolium medium]
NFTNNWWKNAKQSLGAGGIAIPWEIFKREFLVKYFPVDVKNKKVHFIGFAEIRDFATLVNNSRICDEDGRAKTNYYKSLSDKKGKGQDRGKPYDNKGR